MAEQPVVPTVPCVPGSHRMGTEQIRHGLCCVTCYHRKSMNWQKEQGLRHQKLLEDAQRNHVVAVKFLKASLGR